MQADDHHRHVEHELSLALAGCIAQYQHVSRLQRYRLSILSGQRAATATVICGKNAVQLAPTPGAPSVDLQRMAERLGSLGQISANPFLLRLRTEENVLTLFRDGRTIVEGTTEPAQARSIVANS